MLVLPFSLGKRLGKSLPKVDRRIRPPRLDSLQIKLRMKLKHSPEDQIRPRKRVRVADGPQADIFSRPGTQPLRLKQCFPKRHRVLSFRKRNRPAQHATAEIANRLSSSEGRSHLTKIGLRQSFRTRK